MTKKLYHIVVSLVLVAFSLQSHSQTRANQVEAVFLFNFAQFVDWPPGSFGSATAPLVIGILGNDPFGAYIDKVVEGEKLGSHPIIVQRYSDVGEIKNCHILFTNRSYPALKTLQGRSILTVGDQKEFASDGGIIRFYIENNKIRLQINLKAAKTANLNISSKLLRLADVIE